MSAPGFGAAGKAGTWEFGINYRWQRSFRHFRGSEEEENRQQQDSEVINNTNIIDTYVNYAWSMRTTFTVDIPYSMATRSSRKFNNSNFRHAVSAQGVGDISVMARRLMYDPTTSNGNLALGLGVKLPTGRNDVKDTDIGGTLAAPTADERPVDYSIQPGDKSLGIILDAQGFKPLGPTTGYISATYVITPEEKQDFRRNPTSTPTTRNQLDNAASSISDTYLARLGVVAPIPFKKNITVGLGFRYEGVMSRDLIGGSLGFRRSGYAVSWEPTINFGGEVESFFISAPHALYRNRVASVPDKRNGGRPGDAAFADWFVIMGWSWRF